MTQPEKPDAPIAEAPAPDVADDTGATGTPDMDILANPRFNEPPGWRWHKFTTQGGYRVRYGSAHPKDSIADAVVVILPGLRDFAEQYHELAHDLLERNYAVWVIDWRGQGESDRYLPNRQKRHSSGFDDDVRDLYDLVDGYILPSAVHPDVGRLPLVMLGHSMGAHLGMRFLRDCNVTAKGKQIFAAAAFAAPMLWIEQLKPLPMPLAWLVAGALCLFPTAYVPGGRNWSLDYRQSQHRTGLYSHDDVRARLQDTWFTKMPSLQIGSPTTRWLFEAIKSCMRLNKPSYLRDIRVPALMVAAGDDRIVSNSHIEAASKNIADSQFAEIPGALHEILMESDTYRKPFLELFFTFVEQNILDKSDRGMTKF